MRTVVKLAFALAALAAAGCDEATSERWLLEEVRVLAVKAEPPETQPGGTVSLSALAVDPLGAGFRTLSIAWGVCVPDPAVGQASCAEPGRTIPLGTGSSATLTVAADVLDGLDPDLALRGIDLFVVVAASAPEVDGVDGADGEAAFKRVRVSTDPLPNANPRIAWFNPASIPEDGETTLLQAAVTDDSVEEFEGGLGPDVETIRYSWYTTAGALERGVTLGEPIASDLKWKVERPATLYLTARDDRGGLDWVVREVP